MRTYLPNHIIFGNILPLVPSEKLNEWKVACKTWYYHLQSNPSPFIKDQLAKSRRSHIVHMEPIEEYDQHHEHVSTTLDVVFQLDSTTANSISCISRITSLSSIIRNIGLPSYGTFLLGSCNGLVLVNRYSCPEFYLINPSTKQWITLPLPYKRNKAAFAVFGYDRLSEKYKVLLFIDKFGIMKCKVLTLGLKNWKSVILPCELTSIRRRSVLMDGYINLLCNVDTGEEVSDYVLDYVLAFDIGRETFQLLKLPTAATYILDVHGSLAMVPVDGSSYMYYKLVDRSNETWIKEYSIPIMANAHYIHPHANRFFPLTTCNGGNSFVFKEVVGGRLYSFDSEFYCYKEIKTFWDRSRYSSFTYILNHVDTLLSPYAVTSRKRKFIEDPDSAILLRRSLRLQKKQFKLPNRDHA